MCKKYADSVRFSVGLQLYIAHYTGYWSQHENNYLLIGISENSVVLL